MAKFPTFPTLYDNVIAVSIMKLREWGYLKPDQYKAGTLSWSTNGRETGSISIRVNTRTDGPYLELDYKHRDKPVNYTVGLVSVPSNIGKGVVWYFLCPHTGKRCRKLYSVGERFLHREAYTGCMYESQTYSHKARKLNTLFDKIYGTDKLYEQLYQKHFKSHYAGKPTKKYLKLMQKIKQTENVRITRTELLALY
ncbi:hypothetical protein [Pontibacter beigongshangensis]|uniref:hypothetical protein n=1 Tax=Pontibacter beigongshangensis TaxID=2574733 RepID=UPI00164EE707|nr:hypothetical protein [Pontibacter beigongshangensis]